MTHHTPSILGLLFAALLYAVSVSPSLLPRRWWWHGFVSGLLMALGYSQGWLAQNIGYYFAQELGIEIHVDPFVSQVLPWVALTAFMGWVLLQVIQSYRSAYRAALLVQMRPVGPAEYLLGFTASLVMFSLAMLVVRFTVWVFVGVVDFLGNYVADPVAFAVATVIWILLVLYLYQGVILRGTLAFFAREAAKRNDRNAEIELQPQTPLRSGSPQSLCSWRSVGAQGRAFLSRGPSQEEIAKVIAPKSDSDSGSASGSCAEEPIRIYVGYHPNRNNFAAQAKLAVEEAARAGAFSRPYILVYTATGSGWVDEWIVEPFEYLTAGNCATITMQYSYLFSAAILVTDMETCRQAARELFWAVRDYVSTLPPGSRPRIFVGGESLGADGATAPFSSFTELLSSTEGALLVGTPSSCAMSQELTSARHRGSPQVAPVIDSGRQVRFVNSPAQLEEDIYGRELGSWDFPRVVFAQHASDPVVWYCASTMFREPDWIRERAGLDVSPNIRFSPIATYLQILCDMPMAGTAPGGHGHTYTDELIPVWARILETGATDTENMMELGRGLLPVAANATPKPSPDLLERIGTDIRRRMQDDR